MRILFYFLVFLGLSLDPQTSSAQPIKGVWYHKSEFFLEVITFTSGEWQREIALIGKDSFGVQHPGWEMIEAGSYRIAGDIELAYDPTATVILREVKRDSNKNQCNGGGYLSAFRIVGNKLTLINSGDTGVDVTEYTKADSKFLKFQHNRKRDFGYVNMVDNRAHFEHHRYQNCK